MAASLAVAHLETFVFVSANRARRAAPTSGSNLKGIALNRLCQFGLIGYRRFHWELHLSLWLRLERVRCTRDSGTSFWSCIILLSSSKGAQVDEGLSYSNLPLPSGWGNTNPRVLPNQAWVSLGWLQERENGSTNNGQFLYPYLWRETLCPGHDAVGTEYEKEDCTGSRRHTFSG